MSFLLAVPVAPALSYLTGAAPIWVFAAGAVAIAILADWIRRATDQLSSRAGAAVGGLLSVSFGSLSELILALFVLMDGNADVVRAQITGSILATGLLGLGLAIVVGSIGRDEQRFKRERAGLLSSLLILVVVALFLPAVFDFTGRAVIRKDGMGISDEHLSLGVSVVLLLLYAGNLIYTLITHRDVFASGEVEEADDAWPLWLSVAVLLAATAVIAIEAELVSGALEATAGALGLSPLFLGVVVLAMIGTISDVFSAAWFARQDRMGLVMSICVGSAIQVALVLAPLLVIGSWLMGHPMTLVFNNPLELFAIAGTAFAINAIAGDGETTWFEGVLLLGVYLLFGIGFFFVAPPA
ncbi:MAG: calcium/proton exchanger [Rhodospirillales bacterium 20-64-7]|nr:MAG: calcium/proton exchanger [Rhodospirillales bacterium 20-64-7]